MSNKPHSLDYFQITQIFILFLSLYFFFRFGIHFFLNDSSRIPKDFFVYWVTSQRLETGESIYQVSDGSPFKYAPIFAYFFRYTFFLLNQKLAAGIWMTGSLIFFLLSWHHWIQFLYSKIIPRNDPRPFIFTLIGVAIGWKGFLETVSYGQIDLFLLGACLLAFSPSDKLKVGFRTLLVGAILSIKPQLAILGLPFLMIFGLKQTLLAAITTFIFYSLPFLFLDFSETTTLFQSWVVVLQKQSSEVLSNHINQNIGAVAARITGNVSSAGHFIYGGLGILAIFYLFLLFKHLNKISWTSNRASQKKEVFFWISFGLSSYLVFNPLSWRWLTFLWVPLLVFLWLNVESRKLKHCIILSIFWGFLIKFQDPLNKITGVDDATSFLGLFLVPSMIFWLISSYVLLSKKEVPEINSSS